MTLPICSLRSLRRHALLALILALFVVATADIRLVSVVSLQSRSATRDAQKIIMILVEFQDLKHSVSRNTIQDRLSELDTFYREVSYGLAWIKADVTERWYEIPGQTSKWDIQKWSYNKEDMKDFRQKAVTVADPDVDYRSYDYVAIVTAGRVWPNAASGLTLSNNDGVKQMKVLVLNEQSPMGTYAHELGHLLPSEYRPWRGQGLPDLYSYDARERNEPSSIFVGPWCIMDASSPPKQFCAWSKIMLGWITPEVTTASPTNVYLYTIQPLEEASGLRAVKVSLKDGTYFVIEVRTKKGYDRNLPGEGVLIYYVDESKSSGYGVVRVADRNSSTKTLDDAYFRVGDKYENDEKSVYVVVAQVDKLAYTVAVSGSKVLSVKDTDGDGLLDYIEERLGTDPRNPDTDGDGLNDGDEVNRYKTNPLNPDTDGDGLLDGMEIKMGTDPLNPDTDGDGLTDGDEVYKYHTNPLKVDTDDDYWNDRIDPMPTNPFIPNILFVIAPAAIIVLVVVVHRRRRALPTPPPFFAAQPAAVASYPSPVLGPPTAVAGYCIECGFGLPFGVRYCPRCGTKQERAVN